LKDLHPAVKNKPQPLITQCIWSHHKRNAASATPL